MLAGVHIFTPGSNELWSSCRDGPQRQQEYLHDQNLGLRFSMASRRSSDVASVDCDRVLWSHLRCDVLRGWHRVFSFLRRHTRSLLRRENRTLITGQQSIWTSISVIFTIKLSSPPSKSSLATPIPFGCSVGTSGLLTTYSTYNVAQI